MIKETPFHAHNPERSESTCDSRVKTYKTAAGPLFLRTCCPPALVEGLQVDEGLRAFARLPEREHQLLITLARQPENRLTLAYTPAGKIVGQATLAHAILESRHRWGPTGCNDTHNMHTVAHHDIPGLIASVCLDG